MTDVAGDYPSWKQKQESSVIHSDFERYQGPKHHEFVSEEIRRNTFKNWPPWTNQSPKSLAEAGFFYLGIGDKVKCFSCSGGLRNWDPTDDPFVEHAKWFGNCSFLKLVKGQHFINKVHEEHPEISDYQIDQEDCDELAGIDYHQIRKNAESVRAPTEQSSNADEGYSSMELASDQELKDENEQLKTERLCKICLRNDACILFVPCGHLMTCPECSAAFTKCPICRTGIESAIRAYMS